jgi:hypothetical protein
MPLALTDFQWFGSATMPVDDALQNIGGGIDVTKKPIFTRIGSATTLEMLSSAAGDTTQTVTIYYIGNDGVLTSEVKALNGTSVISFTATMKIFLRAVKSAGTTGTVTIRKAGAGATIATMEPAIVDVRIPGYNMVSDPSVAKTYYDKIFAKNNHATIALGTASLILAADPQSVWTFALETSLGGSTTNGAGNNRQVAPSGFSFDAANKNIANSGNFTAQTAQGIWLKCLLPIGKDPFDDTFTLRLSGISGV